MIVIHSEEKLEMQNPRVFFHEHTYIRTHTSRLLGRCVSCRIVFQ